MEGLYAFLARQVAFFDLQMVQNQSFMIKISECWFRIFTILHMTTVALTTDRVKVIRN